jgi:dipeptidyl aminopeptidase/acylaminoacyl peptidase
VHGSGPHDRDETVWGNKPFKDLAWGLASRNIAVLRYEKRTKQYQQETAAMINTLTVQDEVIDDALAAVTLLSKTQGINSRHIFVLGHSLGGMLAPKIASQDSRIAGIIILAGPTRKLPDTILNQYNYLASMDGPIDENKAKQIKAIEQQVKKIKDLDFSEGEIVLGAGKAYWQDLEKYDNVATVKNLTIPMFILQGERDYQVTMEDFNGWTNGLKGMKNVTLKSYADLNHLFIAGAGKSTPAEYNQPGHVNKAVIEDIAAWIKSQS